MQAETEVAKATAELSKTVHTIEEKASHTKRFSKDRLNKSQDTLDSIKHSLSETEESDSETIESDDDAEEDESSMEMRNDPKKDLIGHVLELVLDGLQQALNLNKTNIMQVQYSVMVRTYWALFVEFNDGTGGCRDTDMQVH
ncbi:hypothetical protein D910_04178 [Dendroctonus ponderosae]|uniref:Uncharacterized protein n=1 Tax=Dendroctonus ponderosae TaxID=77166 RepID=U4U119_DENPD|nr:hypothetical protein D910_04178 [Dendroctonus ponderosae]